MSVIKLYHDLKARGVIFEVDGERLIVDAPSGELTQEDREALHRYKPALVRFLFRIKARQEEPQEARQKEHQDDGRRFTARRSRYPGYTSLYDPLEGVWHDFPTKDCFPSIVSLASGKRKERA